MLWKSEGQRLTTNTRNLETFWCTRNLGILFGSGWLVETTMANMAAFSLIHFFHMALNIGMHQLMVLTALPRFALRVYLVGNREMGASLPQGRSWLGRGYHLLHPHESNIQYLASEACSHVPTCNEIDFSAGPSALTGRRPDYNKHRAGLILCFYSTNVYRNFANNIVCHCSFTNKYNHQ